MRIMTTHTAKGLEFPVVILCDGAFQRHGRASRVVNAERRLYACDLGAGIVPWDLIEGAPAEEAEDLAELDRLLYVSMTRARDLVAAPVAEGDFPRDSLLAPVAAALKPLLGRGGITPRVAEPGQPSAPGNARGGKPLWDLLRKDSADGAPEEGKAAEAAFVARRTRALEEGRAPSRAVASATALAASAPALAAPGTALAASSTPLAAPGTEGGAAEVHQLATDPGRPRGVLFGELVHRVLERIPLDAEEPAVRREAARASRELARELERPEELSTSVGTAVLGALGHPLLAEARRAEEHGGATGNCRCSISKTPRGPPPAASRAATDSRRRRRSKSKRRTKGRPPLPPQGPGRMGETVLSSWRASPIWYSSRSRAAPGPWWTSRRIPERRMIRSSRRSRPATAARSASTPARWSEPPASQRSRCCFT